MDVDDLPPAEELWWTAALLAARDRAVGGSGWLLDTDHQVLRFGDGAGREFSLQRLFGGRFALWGIDPADALQREWRGVPGWATSDAIQQWWERSGATFVAWHARDGWDTATPEASLTALEPLLEAHGRNPATARTDPVALQALVGSGDLAAAREILDQARAEAPLGQGRIRRILAREVHAQMSAATERDRMLPQRPVVVVRWVRAARPPAGFAFSVHVDGDAIVADSSNHRLEKQFHRSLLNVFALLHHEERDSENGGWIFARITFDGVNVGFDRAFDSRPHWYVGEGPSLETLAREMGRRTPAWRPAWSRLL